MSFPACGHDLATGRYPSTYEALRVWNVSSRVGVGTMIVKSGLFKFVHLGCNW